MMEQTIISRTFPARLRRSRALRRLNPLFLVTVVVPSLLAIIYFELIASDIYVSKSQFVLRSPDKPSTSGLGVLFKSVGFSTASDKIFATQNYVVSRDALLRWLCRQVVHWTLNWGWSMPARKRWH
jgi:capsule polysaccharide export protein KpsE/RkpR